MQPDFGHGPLWRRSVRANIQRRNSTRRKKYAAITARAGPARCCEKQRTAASERIGRYFARKTCGPTPADKMWSLSRNPCLSFPDILKPSGIFFVFRDLVGMMSWSESSSDSGSPKYGMDGRSSSKRTKFALLSSTFLNLGGGHFHI